MASQPTQRENQRAYPRSPHDPPPSRSSHRPLLQNSFRCHPAPPTPPALQPHCSGTCSLLRLFVVEAGSAMCSSSVILVANNLPSNDSLLRCSLLSETSLGILFRWQRPRPPAIPHPSYSALSLFCLVMRHLPIPQCHFLISNSYC